MISWLAGEQTGPYAHLATDAVALVLPQVQPPAAVAPEQQPGVHLAAGLRFAGMPAALGVLRSQQSSKAGEVSLLSLVVAPQLQGLGLARDLLSWLRTNLKQQGWSRLNVSYPLDHSCTAAMEKLTCSSEGWSHRPGLQLMQLDRSGAAQLVQRLAPVVRHAQRRQRFSLLAWSDLAASTRRGLGDSLRAPDWAHPRDDGQRDPLQALDPAISSVLLDRGQPAGWITAHRVGARMFRVSQWWVKPELQGSGIALLLLHQAVQGALRSPQGYSCGSFGMEPGNTQALNLCERKIAPFACGMNRQRRAWISLTQHDA
jgi:GNAT superfamily N-acetyltransferase/predicted GNAT family acetyltransferase